MVKLIAAFGEFFAHFSEWYDDYENRAVTWWIVGATAFAALIVYGTLYFGGKSAFYALNEESVIIVVADNPCLTDKGLVKTNAPAACYEYKLPHIVVQPTAAEKFGLTRNNDATVTPTTVAAYNPPPDKVYGKRLIKGVIDTVTFHNDERLTADNHLQPDYTEVTFAYPDDDHTPPDSEKFCGNVLDMFNPGDPLGMVVGESKLSDYNGCYTIKPVRLSFGGDYIRPKQ